MKSLGTRMPHFDVFVNKFLRMATIYSKTFELENFRGWFANDHSRENFHSCTTAHVASCMKPIE